MRMRISLATVAIFAVAAGIAYAAIPDAGTGTYHACMLEGLGSIRVIDPETAQCRPNETAITFGAKGDQGIPGPAGAAGAAGSNGSNGVSPTVAQLAPGDANCPAGGAAITDAAGSTAYVCNGADGVNGVDGQPFSGTFTSPNGVYSIGVTDTGVRISSTNGANVTLTGTEITVRSQGTVRIDSSTAMDLRGGSDLTVQAGGNLALKGAATATLQGSGSTTVQGGGVLALTGGLVTLNGGGSSCAPVARVTDGITGVDSSTGQTFLTALAPGAPTVCIGG